MGLEEGYVTSTDIGLGPGVALRLLGNGVVPQQAAYAITNLGERMNSRLDSVDKKNAGVIAKVKREVSSWVKRGKVMP